MDELVESIARIVGATGTSLAGVSCLNLDQRATDAQINEIFTTVEELRNPATRLYENV